jgi:hypothetical protein
MQDVNATVVDLFGLRAARAALPLANRVSGRSLLHPRVPGEDRAALLATSTGVWEAYDAWFGVRYRETVLIGSAGSTWACFDTAHDPRERHALPATRCADLSPLADGAFPPGSRLGP